MAGFLVHEKVVLAPSPDEADIVIINTCSFIHDARDESYQAIMQACEQKQQGLCRAVIVTGCLSQRYGDSLKQQLPDVDAFLGVDQLDRIADIVRAVAAGQHGIVEVSKESSRLFEPSLPGLSFTGAPFAYLKIAEGCNHRCAFCAIPGIRGRHRSRTLAGIVAEAQTSLAHGIRELNIISQDTTAYGSDRADGTDLAALVRALAALEGDFWIRLLYMYPSTLTDALLETVAATPKVCQYFDIPIQHSHPDILRAMQRADTLGPLDNMVGRIRRHMPDATIRTTCLVGFPGETDAHFDHLLATVQSARFDHLGVFLFSPEEGTAAFDLPDRPSGPVAGKRRHRLMTAQKGRLAARNKARIGQDDVVLLERFDPGEKVWIGRTRHQAPEVDGIVFVENVPGQEKAGRFVRVRYIASSGYDFSARFLGDA